MILFHADSLFQFSNQFYFVVKNNVHIKKDLNWRKWNFYELNHFFFIKKTKQCIDFSLTLSSSCFVSLVSPQGHDLLGTHHSGHRIHSWQPEDNPKCSAYWTVTLCFIHCIILLILTKGSSQKPTESFILQRFVLLFLFLIITLMKVATQWKSLL